MNAVIATRPAAEIIVRGSFDLGESARFLAGFAPAARPDAAAETGVLRLAFPVEGGWGHAGVLVRQRAPDTVEVEVTRWPAGQGADVLGQVRRMLSLDIDGRGFDALDRADPVLGALRSRHPGLRPVLFHSPYEAACWAIIGQRIRGSQAARIRQRIVERYGKPLHVGGQRLVSFPAPDVLRELDEPMGLPVPKVAQLRLIADAAKNGVLDAAPLRALEPVEALRRLQRLPGVGPFSAQLILIRGAGHPDVFPDAERRLHEEMRLAYGRAEATVADLGRIAGRWRPYRSWAALLLRTAGDRRPG
ncbi:DNA-3-methyladenine glycosylase family protein [Amycolatopsis nigrescens]|uniref:DNA-3-methyladenine glycosylase family protein n=1 Tax=Amycolatopsis nigrescens TaxID=381445 RepID=UPI0003777062|nr:DNA-3-methyladenine glycosylase [Amycolatopsis nigrescens]